jgi:hypothetical protein
MTSSEIGLVRYDLVNERNVRCGSIWRFVLSHQVCSFSSWLFGGIFPVLTHWSRARRQISAIEMPVSAALTLAARCRSFGSHIFNRLWLSSRCIVAPFYLVYGRLTVYHTLLLPVKQLWLVGSSNGDFLAT